MSKATTPGGELRQHIHRRATFVVEDLLPKTGIDEPFIISIGEQIHTDYPRIAWPEWADQRRSRERCEANGILQVQSRTRVDYATESDSGTKVSKAAVYVLPEYVAEIAQQAYRTQDSMLPCGHRGISNLENGGYACNYPGCDKEFSRGEVDL